MGKTYQSTTVNAPIDKVWGAMRNFHNLSWAANVVTKCDVVGDNKGDQIGARRLLNDAFHETLVGLSDVDHTIRYQITDGPSPVSKDEVSNYFGTVHLFPITDENTTFVEWSSRWDRNDEATSEFCHGIYVALLKDLKAHFAG